MIVVLGGALYRPAAPGKPDAAVGFGVTVARACAALGAPVQFVARVGDDAAGDALLAALARERVGHVAVLRDPGAATGGVVTSSSSGARDEALLESSLDPGDVELALGYLTDIRSIVVADPVDGATLHAVYAAAAYSGVHPIVVVASTSDDPPSSTTPATVLVRPRSDPGGAFADVVARYALAIHEGRESRAAFAAAAAAVGWQATSDADTPV